jgi:hypothetical protein
MKITARTADVDKCSQLRLPQLLSILLRPSIVRSDLDEKYGGSSSSSVEEENELMSRRMTLFQPMHIEMKLMLSGVVRYMIRHELYSVANGQRIRTEQELLNNLKEIKGEWDQIRTHCVQRTLFVESPKELALVKLCFFGWHLQSEITSPVFISNADQDLETMASIVLDIWIVIIRLFMYYLGITQRELLSMVDNTAASRDLNCIKNNLQNPMSFEELIESDSVNLLQMIMDKHQQTYGKKASFKEVLQKSMEINPGEFVRVKRKNLCILSNVAQYVDKVELRWLQKEGINNVYMPSNPHLSARTKEAEVKDSFNLNSFFGSDVCDVTKESNPVLNEIYRLLGETTGTSILYPSVVRPESFKNTPISITVDEGGASFKKASYKERVFHRMESLAIYFDTTIDVRSRPRLDKTNLRYSPVDPISSNSTQNNDDDLMEF